MHSCMGLENLPHLGLYTFKPKSSDQAEKHKGASVNSWKADILQIMKTATPGLLALLAPTGIKNCKCIGLQWVPSSGSK